MRFIGVFLAVNLLLMACSDSEPPTPQNDAGVTVDAGAAGDAGVADSGQNLGCDGRIEEESGLCVDIGIGAQSRCPSNDFASDHRWIVNAGEAEVIFVSPSGTGDGRSSSTPTADPASALSPSSQAAVLVLSKGAHAFAIPDVDDLTMVGACSEQTSVALGIRGPISRLSGQQLRLWGTTVSNAGQGDDGNAIRAVGASRIAVFQTVFDGVNKVLDLDGVATATFAHNTVREVRDVGLGIRGPLSGVIIGDNNFLGPLGGDGVFLGPLGGDGVFRISGNQFANVSGDAVVVSESAISGSIDNNLIAASAAVSGDGVSLIGQAAGVTITVEENELAGMAGSAIVIAEGQATYQVTSNRVGGETGLSGVGVVVSDLTEPGGATLSGNTVTGAVSSGIEVLRNSAPIVLQDNQVTQTSAGDRGPLGDDAAMAYGLTLFDSKNIAASNNTIEDNGTAGALFDLSDWEAYAQREDLSGTVHLRLQGNQYARNGEAMSLNFVIQNIVGELNREGDDEAIIPPDSDRLPASRSARGYRCGNGEINGAEECDEGPDNGGDACSNNCRLPRGRPFDGGDRFFCATTLTGRMSCVGNNTGGQSDPQESSPMVNRMRPRRDLPAGVLEVSAGFAAACARTSQGKVLCWGTGQLGRGQQPRARQEADAVRHEGDMVTQVRQIDMGKTMGCLVRDNGNLLCWGSSTLGDGSYPTSSSLEAVLVKRGNTASQTDQLTVVNDARHVAVGGDFACYLTVAGGVSCWGMNQTKQLGQGDRQLALANCGSRVDPQPCSNHAAAVELSDVTDLDVGQNHACAVIREGLVVCWGNNENNQSRPGLNAEHVPPGLIGGLANVEQVALGRAHSCARKTNGDVLCWGANGDGQLGLGGLNMVGDETRPVKTGPGQGQKLTGQRYIEAGDHSTCSLGPNGTMFCWGSMFLDQNENSYARLITRLAR